MSGRRGALLVNLGTPASADVGDVRRYLREFLSDPKVIDLPGPLRWLFLHAVILPFRPRRSAAQYASIWGSEGSPLLVNGRALRDAVAKRLGEGFEVALGMRYGKPSLASALEGLRNSDLTEIAVLPLYPQYAESATGSSVERIRQIAAATPTPPLRILPPFYDEPGFLDAFAGVARPVLEDFRPDYVLFSYHGLPERQVRAADASGRHCLAHPDCCAVVGADNRRCYRAHSFAITRGLAERLGLATDRHGVAFQSRLGRARWIEPHTDVVIPELAARGVRRLAICCPSFVADCLETLEEIGIRARDQWNDVGGEALILVPSLNADPRWVEAVAGWLERSSTLPEPD